MYLNPNAIFVLDILYCMTSNVLHCSQKHQYTTDKIFESKRERDSYIASLLKGHVSDVMIQVSCFS